MWTTIILAILLIIGGWTDWQRRYSTGGNGDTPTQARRDAQARHHMYGPAGPLG